jgi:hypothetical protein
MIPGATLDCVTKILTIPKTISANGHRQDENVSERATKGTNKLLIVAL